MKNSISFRINKKSIYLLLILLNYGVLNGYSQKLSTDSIIIDKIKNNISKVASVLLSNKAEFSLTYSPDNDYLLFAQKDSFYSSQKKSTIYLSEFNNNSWSEPKIAWFSGTYSDSSPFISPDGKKIYFTSDRPTTDEKFKTDKDIWFLSKEKNGWSSPKHLSIYNSGESEYSPTTDKNGNLYFGSYREDGIGYGDIWVSYYKNGKHQLPINIGEQINTPGGEWGSCIAPEGDFIIFEASGREENITNDGDLFISFKNNNLWTAALHLGQLNSGGSDLTPKIHHNTLYFASNRHSDFRIQVNNNNVELYKINLEILWQYILQ